MTIRRGLLNTLIVLLVSSGLSQAADPPKVLDTQKETIALRSPDQALASLELPEGFRATLFAGEPDVRQPIALATDAKGRLWVAENNTYAEQAVGFDLKQNDRIVILEDADGDGRAERRTVFWEGAKRLTSVELGLGGVWALCPPQLLFVPDRDGDDRPDAQPEVVLDGFEAVTIRHNIANGLRWGPDGWLYGRHGILATSRVGTPGTPADRRTPINCGIWRYHPSRKVFEVVCQGTTNSWGMDWDKHGEPFFINTVIGHLWHVVPGAHFQRMYGEDLVPNLYGLIPQTADHVHWDTVESWDDIRHLGVTPTTDQKGGGHAHSGLMIYQGENWPEKYRGSVFTINLHGRRLNQDTLERRGAGYVGRHGSDHLRSTDPWFRAVELIYGADGGVYIADWSDIGECHEADGVHRSSGRIFKVTYGRPTPAAVTDLRAASNAEVVRLLVGAGEWQARQARGEIQTRAATGKDLGEIHAALRKSYEEDSVLVHRLRALWGLYITGGASEDWLLAQLEQPDEHVRSWAVRLLSDKENPSSAVIRELTAKASAERSGLVLQYLASALQRFPRADRWGLADGLAAHSEFANDPALPLMIWYGIEPAVTANPERALSLAGSSRIPLLSRFVARRLTADLDRAPAATNALSELAARTQTAERQRDLLTGMADALRGRSKVTAPASWRSAQAALGTSSVESVRRLTRELSVIFGDDRVIEELVRLAAEKSEPVDARRDAIRVLVGAHARGVLPLLNKALADNDLAADAARGMASFNEPEITRVLLDRYGRLSPAAQSEALVTLSSRPAFARALLEAVDAGRVDRRQVSVFQVRQMLEFPDEDVRRRVNGLWPGLRTIPAERKKQVERLKLRLEPKTLASADLSNGRRLFATSCALCHTLFGEGGKVGPELTGAQRSNLDYLLENVVDPSAAIGADFRMSTVALSDGRLLNGVVGDRTGPTLSIQTPTERIVVGRDEVEEIRPSDRSLMPDGLLDPLTPEQVRDLVAYLMAPKQVPLPAGSGKSDQP